MFVRQIFLSGDWDGEPQSKGGFGGHPPPPPPNDQKKKNKKVREGGKWNIEGPEY